MAWKDARAGEAPLWVAYRDGTAGGRDAVWMAAAWLGCARAVARCDREGYTVWGACLARVVIPGSWGGRGESHIGLPARYGVCFSLSLRLPLPLLPHSLFL